jgi:hypothetical protein
MQLADRADMRRINVNTFGERGEGFSLRGSQRANMTPPDKVPQQDDAPLSVRGYGDWRDQQALRCSAMGFDLVTSRTPDDLDAFNEQLVRTFASRA